VVDGAMGSEMCLMRHLAQDVDYYVIPILVLVWVTIAVVTSNARVHILSRELTKAIDAQTALLCEWVALLPFHIAAWVALGETPVRWSIGHAVTRWSPLQTGLVVIGVTLESLLGFAIWYSSMVEHEQRRTRAQPWRRILWLCMTRLFGLASFAAIPSWWSGTIPVVAADASILDHVSLVREDRHEWLLSGVFCVILIQVIEIAVWLVRDFRQRKPSSALPPFEEDL
jgi:hypothetical protein